MSKSPASFLLIATPTPPAIVSRSKAPVRWLEPVGRQVERVVLCDTPPNNRRTNFPLVRVQEGPIEGVALGMGARRRSDENQGGNGCEITSCGFNRGVNHMDYCFHVFLSFHFLLFTRSFRKFCAALQRKFRWEIFV